MESNRETGAFDPAPVAAALVGTWRFLVPESPARVGLLSFTNDGEAVQFIFDPQHPDGRVEMRLRYVVESHSELRFRYKPDQEGWTRGYQLQGESLALRTEDRSYVCTLMRVSQDELPNWFQSAFASALSRLNVACHPLSED